METDSFDLRTMFHDDPKQAIAASEKLLMCNRFPSMKTYFSDLKARVPQKTCSASWNSGSAISVSCRTCQKQENSCVCLKCFLCGNHKDHDYVYSNSTMGNCDCGDASFWKEEGVCAKHKREAEQNSEKLSEKEHNLYRFVFGAAIDGLMMKGLSKPDDFVEVVRWLSNFPDCGDEIRDCMIQEFAPYVSSKCFPEMLFNFPKEPITVLLELFGQLQSSNAFSRCFSMSTVPAMPLFLSTLRAGINKSIDVSMNALKKMQDFYFHAFSKDLVENMLRNGVDLEYIIRESLKLISLLFKVCPSLSLYSKSHIFGLQQNIISAIKYSISSNAPFVKDVGADYACMLRKWEDYLPIVRQFGNKENTDNDEKYIANHHFTSQLIETAQYLAKVADPETILMTLVEFLQTKITDTEACPGNPGVETWPALVLHIFLSLTLKNDPREIFQRVAGKLSTTIDYLCILISTMPLRLIAALYYNNFQAFVRNSSNVIVALSSIKYRANSYSRFSPLFLLVQKLFMLSNSNKFLLHIYHIFGCNNEPNANFPFLIFVSCLIFDNSCLGSEEDQMFISIINSLKTKPMTMNDLCKATGFRPNDDYKLFQKLQKITSHDEGAFPIYRLIDDKSWYPFLSLLDLRSALDSLNAFSQRNKISPIPVPEPVFASALAFPILHAHIYKSLLDNETSQRVAMALMISISKLPRKENIEVSMIKGKNAEEIAKFLSGDFIEFLHSPISYNEAAPKTAYEIVCSLGAIGESALERMDINFIPQQTTTNIKKNAALQMKLKIMKEFASAQQAFSGIDQDSDDDLNQIDECGICHMHHTPLSIPVLFFKSNGIRFLSCPHCVHGDCLTDTFNFRCPLDRQKRNALLPIISDPKKPTQKERELTQSFSDRVFGNNIIGGCAQSIFSEIEALEMRLRSDPEAVDKYPPKFLHNLFTAVWSNHSNTPLNFQRVQRKHVLIDLIIEALNCEFPNNTFDKISKLSTKDYVLCRQIALFKHFFINPLTKEQYSDWDEILSPEKLDATPTVLQPLQFIKLPNDFIELARPEYGADLESPYELCMNLFDGGICKKQEIYQYIGDKNQSSSIFLNLTGKEASRVFFASLSFSSTVYACGIYLTCTGEESHGIQYHSRLTLYESRLERLRQEFLSCAWARQV